MLTAHAISDLSLAHVGPSQKPLHELLQYVLFMYLNSNVKCNFKTQIKSNRIEPDFNILE
jgi:hypothetical protein